MVKILINLTMMKNSFGVNVAAFLGALAMLPHQTYGMDNKNLTTNNSKSEKNYLITTVQSVADQCIVFHPGTSRPFQNPDCWRLRAYPFQALRAAL